ncbi:CHRD domain-containing protein [Halostreptopolyspora alba]|uniref:Uncharacterized protein n=1 Tax=Halostreptopolyspora alba TaxID=2487137 RepID=A0A3N0E9W1_9ACTN|nr:hypothetical protein EFW17_12000 [Nocardiopsaceae bacterium YIM 96095]
MHSRRIGVVALAIPMALYAPAAPALADDTTQLHADLTQLNDTGATGTAEVSISGTEVTVDITSHGLLAGQPHAQHFHIGGSNTCPDMSAAGEDGRLNTTEGAPSYGPIKTSLTTEGDTSADSGLAVDRMPAADADGSVSYSRTFEVPEDVAASVKAGEAVIVQHGVDYNGNGEYDFDGGGESELDESLPTEATDPATCGQLTPAPEGGMAAGAGGMTASEADMALLAVGTGLVAAAGTAAVFGLRRSRAAEVSGRDAVL